QRIVFAQPPDNGPWLERMKEVMRLSQAYIVLREMGGGTGGEVSSWKRILPDEMIRQWSDERGVIRREDNRFKIPGAESLATRSLEQRAGTKTDSTRRQIHKWVVSYAGSGDFGKIGPVGDWTLIDAGPQGGNAKHLDPQLLSQRFGVDVET